MVNARQEGRDRIGRRRPSSPGRRNCGRRRRDRRRERITGASGNAGRIRQSRSGGAKEQEPGPTWRAKGGADRTDSWSPSRYGATVAVPLATTVLRYLLGIPAPAGRCPADPWTLLIDGQPAACSRPPAGRQSAIRLLGPSGMPARPPRSRRSTRPGRAGDDRPGPSAVTTANRPIGAGQPGPTNASHATTIAGSAAPASRETDRQLHVTQQNTRDGGVIPASTAAWSLVSTSTPRACPVAARTSAAAARTPGSRPPAPGAQDRSRSHARSADSISRRGMSNRRRGLFIVRTRPSPAPRQERPVRAYRSPRSGVADRLAIITADGAPVGQRGAPSAIRWWGAAPVTTVVTTSPGRGTAALPGRSAPAGRRRAIRSSCGRCPLRPSPTATSNSTQLFAGLGAVLGQARSPQLRSVAYTVPAQPLWAVDPEKIGGRGAGAAWVLEGERGANRASHRRGWPRSPPRSRRGSRR